MVENQNITSSTITVEVELFGLARIAYGARSLEISLPECTNVSDMVAALADACPTLVGKAIQEDRQSLLVSYAFNLNGTEFLDADDEVTLKDGDSLLLFSSQAGG